MKKLLPLLLVFTSYFFFTGCKKEEDEVKVEIETPLLFQERMLKGKWKFKEGYTRKFDQNGNIISGSRTTAGRNDKTTFSYDGQIRTVDYDPYYNRPPAKNAYTITEKNEKFYLNMTNLLYLKDPDAVYTFEIFANTDALLENAEFIHKDGTKVYEDKLYVRAD